MCFYLKLYRKRQKHFYIFDLRKSNVALSDFLGFTNFLDVCMYLIHEIPAQMVIMHQMTLRKT